MRRIRYLLFAAVLVLSACLTWVAAANRAGGGNTFLPVALRPQESVPPGAEFRGIWVTRFDWTSFGQPAQPGKIDEIVNNVDLAGFNAILFQVRGEADAYYQPGPEPWAARVSGGVLGQPPNPYWDPFAYLIQQAHARGIQVHAYVNAYPVWANCVAAPPHTSPEHLYHLLAAVHGTTDGKLNGLMWTTADEEHCSGYRRASPASLFVDDQLLSVANYLTDHYDLEGIHLDHIRYGSSNTSCDPVSEASAGVQCFDTPPGYGSYGDFQRAQVNGTVSKFYNQVILPRQGLMLSAASWPVYINYWGWQWSGGSISQGYYTFYQDAKGWVAGNYIDAIMPMIYGNEEAFSNLERWTTLVADYQEDRNGRFVIPGIDAYEDFGEIVARINAARAIGTAGHAIFSYGALKAYEHFDDLAAGPYAELAVVPPITWHP
jgi:uncharacterized lipoprotein YddW (UPF0748 family)